MKCRDCEHWGWGDDEGTPVWGWCWIRTSCPDPDIERTCPDFSPKAPDIFTTLSTLQAENEKLREKIEDARLEGYAKGLGEMSAELEQVRAGQEDLISRKDAVAYALSLYRKLTAQQAASRTELDIGGAMVYTAGAEIAKAMACRMMELPRPQARPHGYWFDRGSLSCRCSHCGCKSTAELPECPVCGAVMDLESPQ